MVDHQTHAHAHCVRNEQCTCAYDLNKTRWLPDGVHFGQVLDQKIKALS